MSLKSTLFRSVEQREEEYSKLEIEHQKSLKTIKGLEAYIRTLPSVEDFREVKAKLEAKIAIMKSGLFLCPNTKDLQEYIGLRSKSSD